jgi:predicted dehydrogenase
MVRIGIVGIGFMGRIHFLAAQRLTGAAVVAVCSRDPAKLAGDWTNTRGNFGPPPGHVDLTGVRTYSEFAALLADPEVDLVDICTVTHTHKDFAIAALRAGKHVLVEKAIALSVADADEMLAAARAAGRLLMVAHVLPFFPEFAFAARVVREGVYGRLLAAHFTRIISRPDWSADIADAAKTGGPAVDLHIHDTHFIGLLAGVPRQVFASGVIDQNTLTYLTTHYLYGPGGPAVSCAAGAIAQKARQFIHGYEIYLERATLSYDSATRPLLLLHADGQTEQPQLPGSGDALAAFADELQTAAEAVRSGVMPPLLSGQLARDALALCVAECQSAQIGQTVSIG